MVQPSLGQVDAIQASYDAIPYDSQPIPAAHIELLAIEALLAGLAPAPIARCRVLELGCAGGGHLLPMADEFPHSEFVGIDLSTTQIAQGRELIAKAGLSNVQLTAVDLMDVGSELGHFDYIIAHGLYSWVPPAVQRKTLEVFAERLNPGGVGYLSFNAYPGYHHRQIMRDMLLRHVGDCQDERDAENRSRQFLATMLDSDSSLGNLVSPRLRDEAKLLLDAGHGYARHETLAPVHEALYFEEFARRLATHGLQYLAECRPRPTVRRTARDLVVRFPELKQNRIALEQYIDFFAGTQFRRCAIVKAGKPLLADHDAAWVEQLGLRTLSGQKGPVDLTAGAEVYFSASENAGLAFHDPVIKALLWTLSERRPLAIRFEDVLVGIRAKLTLGPEFAAPGTPQRSSLAAAAMYCRDLGLLDFCFPERRFTLEISDRPAVSRLVRAMLASPGLLSSRLHNAEADLTPTDRFVMSKLDGLHDVDDLCDAIEAALIGGEIPRPAPNEPDLAERVLMQSINRIAERGFLVG